MKQESLMNLKAFSVFIALLVSLNYVGNTQAQSSLQTEYFQCHTGGCEGKPGFLNGDFCIVVGDVSTQADPRTACEITAVTGCQADNSNTKLYTCGYRSCTSGHGDAVALIGDIQDAPPEPSTYASYDGNCEFFHNYNQAPDQRIFDLRAYGPFTCPTGQFLNPFKNGGNGGCQTNNCPSGETWLPPDGNCGVETMPPSDCPYCACGEVGNPCDPGTGNKYQPETDYASNNLLSITRGYNSQNTNDFGFGIGWSSNLLKGITVKANELSIWQRNGRGELFTGGNGLWIGEADTNINLVENNGFLLTDPNGDTENYNTNGRLASETTASGRTTTYMYNGGGKLITVTNPYGHAFTLTWAGDHVDTITTPRGGVYDYDYDIHDRLAQVTYPDATSRQYHYENQDFYYLLTGITDENGDRYATFVYDSQGRAISTEHADVGNGVQEKFSIDYTQ